MGKSLVLNDQQASVTPCSIAHFGTKSCGLSCPVVHQATTSLRSPPPETFIVCVWRGAKRLRETRFLGSPPQPGFASPGLKELEATTPPWPRVWEMGCPSWSQLKPADGEEMSHTSRPWREEMPGSFCFYTALAEPFLCVPATHVSSLNARNSHQRWARLLYSSFSPELREAKQVAQGHQ